MPKSGNKTIERLQEEAGVTSIPTLSAKTNLEDAVQMFKDLLEEPNANAVKIGKISGINAVAISQLKNGKMESITDAMYGKLKKLYDAVRAGKIAFEETKRGRKVGQPVAPKQAKQKVAKAPAKVKAAPAGKAKQFMNEIIAEYKETSAEIIAEKELELEKLMMVVKYLKDLKALQDKYRD